MATDFLGLLRLLQRHQVELVVVGGVAAVLGGAPIATLDLDIVYEPSEDNLTRLAAALAELEALYRDPAGRRIQPTIDRLRSNRSNLLATRLGLLDAMQQIGTGWTWSDVETRSRCVRAAGLEIRVLDLAAVIESKEAANRPKDRAALPVLRRTLELLRAERR